MAEYSEKLRKVIKNINTSHGANSVVNLEEVDQTVEILCSTGSLGLDLAIGVNGYPKGRMIEIYGPESSGKTTLTLHAIAEAQKKDIVCAFVDMEHAFDAVYAEALGVDTTPSGLLFSQPDDGEQALNIVEALVDSGEVGLIIVDSVAALIPKAELEGGMGDHSVGLHARLMSRAMRKLAGITRKTGTTIIWINQLRMKIGIAYGNPEVTTGGNALKFYTSIRLDIRRIEKEKHQEDGVDIHTAARTRVKVLKNKVAPPFKECIFSIEYGKGISKTSEIVEVAIVKEVMIKKSGKPYLNYDTPLWNREEPIESTVNYATEYLQDPEMEKVLHELTLRVDVALGQLKEVDMKKQLSKMMKTADSAKKDFEKYWELGQEASGKSQLLEAKYYIEKALSNMSDKNAESRLKAINKRIEDKIKKDGPFEELIIETVDGKINLDTGEIVK